MENTYTLELSVEFARLILIISYGFFFHAPLILITLASFSLNR